MARELSKNPTVLIVNDTIFAHGGVMPVRCHCCTTHVQMWSQSYAPLVLRSTVTMSELCLDSIVLISRPASRHTGFHSQELAAMALASIPDG